MVDPTYREYVDNCVRVLQRTADEMNEGYFKETVETHELLMDGGIRVKKDEQAEKVLDYWLIASLELSEKKAHLN